MKAIRILHIGLIFLLISRATAAQEPVINELMTANDTTIEDIEGNSSDWIELFNPNPETINLKGWGLTDDRDEPGKWQFGEATIPPYGFMLVFASGKTHIASEWHASFRLAAGEEPVYLVNPEGRFTDSITSRCIPQDISYGRKTDGGAVYQYFGEPSPGYTNNHSESIEVPIITDTLQFSHRPGYFDQPVSLRINSTDTSLAIFYTLNGTEPHPDNHAYQKPISLKDRTYDDNDESDYQTSDDWQEPDGNVLKGTVVRATAYKNGCPQSRTINGSYFFGNPFKEIMSRLPVISLGVDEDSLFRDEEGIYAKSIPETEKGGSLEIFTDSLNQDYEGLGRISVMDDGALDKRQKSMRIHTVDEPLSNQLLSDKTSTETFSHFNLLSPIAMNNQCLFEQTVIDRLIRPSQLLNPANKPAVVFINGEYWGIHYFTGNLSKGKIAADANIDTSHLEIIYHTEDIITVFSNMQALLNSQPDFSAIENRIAIKNFAALHASYSLAGNLLGHPVLWRVHDGPWHFALALGKKGKQNAIRCWSKAKRIHNKLVEYVSYRKTYASETIRLLASDEGRRRRDIADSILRHYGPLVAEHIRRWNYPADIMEWQSDVDDFLSHLEKNTTQLASSIDGKRWNPIHINPNPTSGEVKIKSEFRGFVRILDSDGRLVHQAYSVEDPITVNTSAWSAGVYIVRLIGANLQYARKLVVVP